VTSYPRRPGRARRYANAHPPSPLENFQQRSGEALESLQKLLAPGCKLALVMWTPGYEERELVITRSENSLAEIEATVRRRRTGGRTVEVN
jgi:hypothetical protein